MPERLNPSAIAAPAGSYSHAILVKEPGGWLHIAGQIGMRPDGSLGEGVAEQADIAWQNLSAILQSAGMDVSHLVKVTTYLVEAEDLAAINPVRVRYLGDARPASTLVVAKALARKEWLIEVEATAFRAD